MEILIGILCALVLLNIILVLAFRPRPSNDFSALSSKIDALQSSIREDFRINRAESATTARDTRQELNATLKDFSASLNALQ